METLVREFELIAERVFERKFADSQMQASGTDTLTSEILVLRAKFESINSKEHISISEAALLLNCSAGHIRNLIHKARKKQTKRPIPFIDLDGVTVFNRIALLGWANPLPTPCKAEKTSQE